MLAADLKNVYRAVTEEQGLDALKELEQKWQSRYPMIAKSWYSNWNRLNTFFAYPEEIRRVIYTTNVIESLNSTLRKVTKNRGSFPNDDAGIKLLYMALKNIMKKWTMPIQNWGSAINQMSIIFEGRIPQ
jgi:putative transposase